MAILFSLLPFSVCALLFSHFVNIASFFASVSRSIGVVGKVCSSITSSNVGKINGSQNNFTIRTRHSFIYTAAGLFFFLKSVFVKKMIKKRTKNDNTALFVFYEDI
jgi:hypothetical protein